MGKPPRGTKGVIIVVAKTTVDRVDTQYMTERLVSHIEICSFFTMQLTVRIPHLRAEWEAEARTVPQTILTSKNLRTKHDPIMFSKLQFLPPTPPAPQDGPTVCSMGNPAPILQTPTLAQAAYKR